MSSALVLSGAVGQGAFDAGVLRYLAEQQADIDCVSGASSGALNGLTYAAGIREGEPLRAAEALCELWRREASLWHLVRTSLSLRGVLERRGVFDQRLLLRLMRRHIAPCTSGERHGVEFRVVVAPLRGRPTEIRGNTHRTHELVQSFRDADFDSAAELERMYAYVSASAAFPFLFRPVELPQVGESIDGGAVNDNPIGAVCGHAKRIILVSVRPRGDEPAKPLSGIALIEQLADILIHERLIRDLRRVPDSIELIEVRPPAPLEGDAFTSLMSERLRASYVERGYEAARRALGG